MRLLLLLFQGLFILVRVDLARVLASEGLNRLKLLLGHHLVGLDSVADLVVLEILLVEVLIVVGLEVAALKRLQGVAVVLRWRVAAAVGDVVAQSVHVWV